MRDFTRMTVVPGAAQIAVDGEIYTCDPFAAADLKGSTNTVPADKIFVIHWYGDKGHGHVEKEGLAEGFHDRTQIEPYLKHWLAARAQHKGAQHDAAKRTHAQAKDYWAQCDASIAALTAQIAAAKKELAAAKSPEQTAHAQAMLDVLNNNLAHITHHRGLHYAPEDQLRTAIDAAKAAADAAAAEHAAHLAELGQHIAPVAA